MKWENEEKESEGEETRKVVGIQTLARESGPQDCVSLRMEGNFTSLMCVGSCRTEIGTVHVVMLAGCTSGPYE